MFNCWRFVKEISFRYHTCCLCLKIRSFNMKYTFLYILKQKKYNIIYDFFGFWFSEGNLFWQVEAEESIYILNKHPITENSTSKLTNHRPMHHSNPFQYWNRLNWGMRLDSRISPPFENYFRIEYERLFCYSIV